MKVMIQLEWLLLIQTEILASELQRMVRLIKFPGKSYISDYL
jgi:hypothetical protein